MKKIIFILVIIFLLIISNSYKVDTSAENEEIYVETQVIDNPNKYNYSSIKIGDSKEETVSLVGNPNRIDVSEFDFEWYVYNEDLSAFFMIGMANDEVVALYSNCLDSLELEDIKLGENKFDIRNNFTPIEYKKKGNVKYIVDSNDEYDIIEIDNNYVTLFYDIHDNYKIVSYQIINKNQEYNIEGIYAKESEELKISYELQIIDLCNVERIKNGLEPLEYSQTANISSENHSEDMMVNNYFSHDNLENESPFDRMKAEGIKYITAGENICAGQTSAIYAHYAWMNSLGHRKNILGNYKYIGVGIAFGGHYSIYYTQNFYK